LLTHEGIPAGGRLVTVNDHTEAVQVHALLGRLDAGELVALVTDAGMPAVSDPGERLVTAAAAAGHRVEVVPGPSAALAALVVSGLPTGRFCFEGFLPRKGRARAQRLAEVAAERRTTVMFEAPHRVRQTVADLSEVIDPQRRLVIARELTKAFEEVWRGTLATAGAHLGATEPRGEFVLVLDGAAPAPVADAGDVDRALQLRLDAGVDKKAAIAEVAAELGVPKRQVYQAALSLGAPPPGRTRLP
jgi:16S rRNA (cytidine1402-2'-O)-methyltransferase